MEIFAISLPVWPFINFCDTTGATFWKPKMCLSSTSSVYFELLCCGSVVNPSPPVTWPLSIRV